MLGNQCDYIGQIPVYLFYTTDFFSCDTKSYFYNRMGMLRQFNQGSKLPLRTLYYKFPDNFYIMTYGKDEILVNIENGIYSNMVSINNADTEFKPIYDIWGNLTVAKNSKDIKIIKMEYERFENGEISSDWFISLWLKQDNSSLDISVFGRYLEVFRKLYFSQDKSFEALKDSFKEFLEKQDIQELKDKYINWIENESLISFKDIDIIIKKVLM